MPDDFFQPMTYEQFEDWKLDGYVIPESVACIMRIKNLQTGKIKERYYNSSKWAQKRVKECMKNNLEFTLVSMEGTFHLTPNEDLQSDY